MGAREKIMAWSENKRVYICSPFRGAVLQNTKYAQKALRDSLDREEAPLVVHLVYPQALNDDNTFERNIAINAGVAWLKSADLLAVYSDRGISEGMWLEIGLARELNIPVEVRSIPADL